MDSIAVVIEKHTDICSRGERLRLTVSLPTTPIHAETIIDDYMLRSGAVPKGVHVRELVRMISRHIEEDILAALKRTRVV